MIRLLSLLFRKHPALRFLLLPLGFLVFSLFFSVISLAFNRKPTIDSINPAIGEPGEIMLIRGDNFGDEMGDSWVEIAGERLTASTSLSWTDTLIKIALPSTVSDGLLYVRTHNGKSNPELFANRENIPVSVNERTDPGLPSIAGIGSQQGAVGDSVTISGSNFGLTRNQSQVFFSWQLDPAIPRSGQTQSELSVIPCSDYDFDYEYWSDQEIRVRVPDGAGSGNVYVRTERGMSNGMPFTVQNPVGTKKFGAKRTYVISTEVSVTNVVAAGDNILYLRIPRPVETASQQGIDISASSVEPYMKDYKGSILHRLDNLIEGDKKRITHSFIMTGYSTECAINPAKVKAYSRTDSPLYTAYTAPDALVPSGDPGIAEKGAEIVKKEKNPYRKAEAIYKWVTENVAWTRDVPANRTAGQTLAALNGDSQDLAVLFCALARAQGIPSIPVAGLLVDSTRNSAVHWWAEFYVEGFGWVPVDLAIPAGGATAGEGGKTESTFGSLDVNHIAFTRGWANEPPMLPNSKIVWRNRSWASQPVWEEAAGNISGYTSYWAEPKIAGVY